MSTWSSRSRQTQRRTSSSRRRPCLTKVSGVWGALAALFTLLAAVLQTVELVVAAAVLIVITIISAFAGNSVAVPTRAVEVKRTSSPGGRGVGRKSALKPGTPSKGGKCSHRCRHSTAPKSTCRCKSPTCAHGSESGVLVTAPPSKPKLPTRSQLRSRTVRKRERTIVRQQRRTP
jgi:hypothetical protein